MKVTPLLILSDNPSYPTGLARICRDVATLACTMPEFRVAVLGRGIGQRRKFPFLLYDFPEYGQWGESYIQQAWDDFSGGERGVILTIWDLTRCHWLVNPVGLPADLQQFLGDGRRFQRWAYVPLDSAGPDGEGLPTASTDCLLRYDRVLAASEFGHRVMITSGRKDADWLPHGLWLDKFHATTKPEGPEVTVGSVMANQARKDYPTAFGCFAILRQRYGNLFHAWLHTDTLTGYWNVPALAADYGITDCLECTTGLSDDQLALRYSACDCTILPSGGEGFGYPIAESLACGTAPIVTNYAAGAELAPVLCRVDPLAYRVDTQHNVLRAVLGGVAFADAAEAQIDFKREDWEYRSQESAATVAHLDWNKLKYPWMRWLREGLWKS